MWDRLKGLSHLTSCDLMLSDQRWPLASDELHLPEPGPKFTPYSGRVQPPSTGVWGPVPPGGRTCVLLIKDPVERRDREYGFWTFFWFGLCLFSRATLSVLSPQNMLGTAGTGRRRIKNEEEPLV